MNSDYNSENSKIFIAFATKGLEHITEGEIKLEFPQASIISVLTKRVIFSISNISIKELLQLKTADDIHLLVKSFENTESLDENFILKHCPLKEIKDALKYISQFRTLNKSFSLTLSKYKNDIDLESVRSKISEVMEESLGMNYAPRDHSNFDVRIHIENSNISFSCKLPTASLYNRSYRKCELKGALKPTIAAALCLLISPNKREKIVDNFCGTGTILCEAFLQKLEPYGGDINDDAVECALKNMGCLSLESTKNIKVLDAKSTKWPNSYFDYAVSNLPWGKQVELTGIVKLYSASIAEYARILKKEGSIVLLGMNPDLIVKHLKKNFPNHKIMKFQIGFLGQTPWIVCALSRNKPEIYCKLEK